MHTAGSLAAALVLVAAPPAVQPTYIQADDGRHSIVYEAPGDRVNSPVLSVSSADTDPVTWTYTLHDTGPIEAAIGCSYPDPADKTTVACVLHEVGDFVPLVQLWLGQGDDTMDQPTAVDGLEVHGESGDDTLTAIHFGVVYGDSGNDHLVARWADGGAGDDVIHARIAQGGPGADLIVGNTDPRFRDDLRGGSGDDTIQGRGGDDSIYGNGGDDVLTGGDGDDRLSGGPGADRLSGGSGDDVLLGGAGRDALDGGPGRNTLRQ